MLVQALHVNSKFFGLAYLQLFFFILLQQVTHSFVINLHHADHYFERLGDFFIVLYFLKYFIANDRNDSSIGTVSDHRVGFSGTCLSVSEETAVVALPSLIKIVTMR